MKMDFKLKLRHAFSTDHWGDSVSSCAEHPPDDWLNRRQRVQHSGSGRGRGLWCWCHWSRASHTSPPQEGTHEGRCHWCPAGTSGGFQSRWQGEHLNTQRAHYTLTLQLMGNSNWYNFRPGRGWVADERFERVILCRGWTETDQQWKEQLSRCDWTSAACVNAIQK